MALNMFKPKYLLLAIVCTAALAIHFNIQSVEVDKIERLGYEINQLSDRLNHSEQELAYLRGVVKDIASMLQPVAVPSRSNERVTVPVKTVATDRNTLSDTDDKPSIHALPAFGSSSDAVAWAQDNILDAEQPPRRMQALQLLLEHDPSAAVAAIHTLISQNDSEIGDVVAGFGIIEMAESPDILPTAGLKQVYMSKNPNLRRVSAKILLDRGDSYGSRNTMAHRYRREE